MAGTETHQLEMLLIRLETTHDLINNLWPIMEIIFNHVVDYVLKAWYCDFVLGWVKGAKDVLSQKLLVLLRNPELSCLVLVVIPVHKIVCLLRRITVTSANKNLKQSASLLAYRTIELFVNILASGDN